MAFRRQALAEVGGFDPQFRAAGDDVDLCWRLLAQGMKIGFHPAAVVWHHRRSSARTYLKQQRGYGRAEAMLARKWPSKFNDAGHITWSGSIYGRGLSSWLSLLPARVYQGVWGTAPFQSIYERSPGMLVSVTLMPEWFLLIALLGGLTAMGLLWTPLLAFAPLAVLAAAAPVVRSLTCAWRANPWRAGRADSDRLTRVALTAALHLLQPLARLTGRLAEGLCAGMVRTAGWKWPVGATVNLWCPDRQSQPDRLTTLQDRLTAAGAHVQRGDVYDDWDLTVRSSMWGAVRLCMASEDHGSMGQMVRVRYRPRVSWIAPACIGLCAALATLAALDGAAIPAATLTSLGVLTALRRAHAVGSAVAAVRTGVMASAPVGTVVTDVPPYLRASVAATAPQS